MNHIIDYLRIILLLSLLACRPDAEIPSIKEDLPEETKAYLEDFRSAEYKWGYIDSTGKEIIPAIYEDNRDFSQGYAAAQKGPYWGYIDHNNQVLVDFQFRAAYDFKEDVAIVQNLDKSFAIIDKSGKIIKQMEVDFLGSSHNGRLKAKLSDYEYFINKKGEEISDYKYDRTKEFTNGYAMVYISGKWGLIDTNEQRILEIEYNDIIYLDEDYYSVTKDNQHMLYCIRDGFINLPIDGKVIDLQENIAHIKSFKKELLYNINNQSIINDYYDQYIKGNDHRWIVRKGSKWGLLNNNGKEILSPMYDIIYRFEENRAAFMTNDQWGYLDENGQEIFPAISPLAWDYHHGLARCILDRGVGFINLEGKVAIQPLFIEVRDFYEGKARYQKFR